MATESDEPRTDTEIAPEEEEGGPVKSFLEHLEDLRWVLIKSGTALFVTVVVCLLGGPVVVKVLMHPLEQARSVAGFGKYVSDSWLIRSLRESSFGKSSYGSWLFRKKDPNDPNSPQ